MSVETMHEPRKIDSKVSVAWPEGVSPEAVGAYFGKMGTLRQTYKNFESQAVYWGKGPTGELVLTFSALPDKQFTEEEKQRILNAVSALR